jgi:hypothetical protein
VAKSSAPVFIKRNAIWPKSVALFNRRMNFSGAKGERRSADSLRIIAWNFKSAEIATFSKQLLTFFSDDAWFHPSGCAHESVRVLIYSFVVSGSLPLVDPTTPKSVCRLEYNFVCRNPRILTTAVKSAHFIVNKIC